MELIAVILLVLLVLFGEVGLYRRRGLQGRTDHVPLAGLSGGEFCCHRRKPVCQQLFLRPQPFPCQPRLGDHLRKTRGI